MSDDVIETFALEDEQFWASETFVSRAVVRDPSLYQAASEDRLRFWEDRAKDLVWSRPWERVLDWVRPVAKWFVNGKLNASVNCLDRHLVGVAAKGDKPAIVWEGELGAVRQLSYAELSVSVNQLANVLRHRYGVQKGDRVTLYMPLIPELAIAVLACARIGAIHSVVFGGFSATALKDRIVDSGSCVVVTADGGYRRGTVVPLKTTVDDALCACDTPVRHVLVVQHIGGEVPMQAGRDDFYEAMVFTADTWCEPEEMDSEDPLFILYTSGTTGKPKGIVHSTGGYMTHAHYSTQIVFDLKDEDVYWCTADIGWITGHTYVVYGPLANGATVFMYEGAPDYPDEGRFWDLIQKHKVSIFYTAPTAIRAFMKWGEALPAKYDLSSLRVLGSVGEPINPEAWKWYYQVIGGQRCPIVDTWWQTETGGIMISTLPSVEAMRPGFAGQPLPGISAKVVAASGDLVTQGGGYLTLTEPWPSMLRGIWGDMDRYHEVYWSTLETYFSGDGAMISEGYIKVLGRMDDVLNVAGHRIGTMEIESALVSDPDIAEAAVVAMPDDIKGQAIVAFVILKEGAFGGDDAVRKFQSVVTKEIGAIARPKYIIITPELPKTRSGKIMRRLLKNIVHGQPVGDVSTLANPDAVSQLATLFSMQL